MSIREAQVKRATLSKKRTVRVALRIFDVQRNHPKDRSTLTCLEAIAESFFQMSGCEGCPPLKCEPSVSPSLGVRLPRIGPGCVRTAGKRPMLICTQLTINRRWWRSVGNALGRLVPGSLYWSERAILWRTPIARSARPVTLRVNIGNYPGPDFTFVFILLTSRPSAVWMNSSPGRRTFAGRCAPTLPLRCIADIDRIGSGASEDRRTLGRCWELC
jgi:hypothetical protein